LRLVVKPSLPRKNNGLIDGERLLYIATVRLKLPYGALDEYTPGEIMTLNEYYLEDQREHYELTSYAVTLGYASAKKGRRIKMFEDHKEESKGRVTKVQKKAELDYLKGLF
jgi:hypothetical protein